jgi:hypothetical protein
VGRTPLALEAMNVSCRATAAAPLRRVTVATGRRTRSHGAGNSAAHADVQAARLALPALTAAQQTGRAAAPVAPASRRAARVWQLAAVDEGSEAKGGAADDDVTFEPMRKARVKGRLQAKVKVSTPTADAALGNAPPTEVARAETTAVLALTAVFAVFMIEGFIVASSGFMSEEWDAIVQARARCAGVACATAMFASLSLTQGVYCRRRLRRRTCCPPSHPLLACSWRAHQRMVRRSCCVGTAVRTQYNLLTQYLLLRRRVEGVW